VDGFRIGSVPRHCRIPRSPGIVVLSALQFEGISGALRRVQ
jgi:hypothetical protein